SGDGGKTWSLRYEPILQHEGLKNVMSVSLLRLPDGAIAMFYLRKNSTEDCVPLMRVSTDEARSWSEPVPCIAEAGYYVLNNDRAVQLKSGRIILPMACHAKAGEKYGRRGTVVCAISDTAGRTWKRSTTELAGPETSKTGLQEPAVVELKDGRLMMLCRTALGSQYR